MMTRMTVSGCDPKPFARSAPSDPGRGPSPVPCARPSDHKWDGSTGERSVPAQDATREHPEAPDAEVASAPGPQPAVSAPGYLAGEKAVSTEGSCSNNSGAMPDSPAAAAVGTPAPIPEAEGPTPPPWHQLPGGRWVVGDPGRQHAIVPKPSFPRNRPDTIVDGAIVGRLTFRAASLRGLSHQQYAKPRQDTYAFDIAGDGRWLVGCVADGVSQGRWSHHAADLAARRMVSNVAEALSYSPAEQPSEDILESLPWQNSVDAASEDIIRAASSKLEELRSKRKDDDAPLPDFLSDSQVTQVMSTTAIMAVLGTEPDDAGRHSYAVAVAAGDSSAFVITGGKWCSLTHVKNEGNEIVSSAVRPLPRPQKVELFQGHLEAGDVLLLMTDGLGDPLGSGHGAVGRFLGELWSKPPDLLSFAAQLGFLRRTFTDDRTAFVSWVTESR